MAPSPISATLHARMAFAARLPIHAHITVRQALASLVLREEGESDNDSDDYNDDYDDDHVPAKGINLDPIHYYFLLLLVLLATVGLLSWFICRRRRLSKKSRPADGEQAQAMNAQGWTNTLHGRCIPSDATLVGPNSNPTQDDEAPPPYQAKTDAAPPYPSFPLRTLSQNENDRSRPPHYTEYYGTRQDGV